jgi:mono/diheme cytochrome c family protein
MTRHIGWLVSMFAMSVCVLHTATGQSPQGTSAMPADDTGGIASSACKDRLGQRQRSCGGFLFAHKCAGCHILDPQQSAPKSLRGSSFQGRWGSTRDLRSKISQTMPANRVGSLSDQEYQEILGYLLTVNGWAFNEKSVQSHLAPLATTPSPSGGRVPTESAAALDPSGQDYYTVAQAERGASLFQGSCALCHTTAVSSKEAGVGSLVGNFVSASPPEGLAVGSVRLKVRLVGEDVIAKYHSVGDLFAKLSSSMPAYDAHGLDQQTYVDITAYLLHANGLPAGDRPLRPGLELMHAMTLVEPGFKRLFNGRDLTGFGVLLGHNCTPAPEGCGATVSGSTFRAEKGSLYCSGHPLGYLYTENKYLNFTLRMDYKFTRFDDIPVDEPFFGNTGWFLFIQKHQVWPKAIEIQGREPDLLDVIPLDTNARFTVDVEARKRALRPLQWNSVEIVAREGHVESYLNGVLVSVITQHEFTEPGYIGLQSEGGHVQFRNIQIRAE